jgi:hypothetical protein
MLRAKEEEAIQLDNNAKAWRDKCNLFLGRYEHTKILEELRDMMEESKELKELVRELRAEYDYGKQRENKLMYFLYLMQQEGMPVYDLFEVHIKDLPTSRFSTNLNQGFKGIYLQEQKKKLDLGLVDLKKIIKSERATKPKWFKSTGKDVEDSTSQ